MGVHDESIISDIKELIANGKYKEAYEYSISIKSRNLKQNNTVQCFRYLLACLNEQENIGMNEFTWEIKDVESYKAGIDFMRKEYNIDCQKRMFKDLRELCKKNLNK